MNNDTDGWKVFATLLIVWTGAALSRLLRDEDGFSWQVFASEMILALIGAIIIYNFGVWQEWPMHQVLFVGAFTSLGGVRFVEQITRLIKSIKLGD